MKICYVDEAGDGEKPDPASVSIPPAFVICGLVVDADTLSDLTRDFLRVKARFHPAKAGARQLDGILSEVKGSDLRRDMRSDPSVLGSRTGRAQEEADREAEYDGLSP